MTIGRRPRLAAMLATSLGGALVAGVVALAPGSAAGEATAAAEPAALGWAVTNLSTSAVPQTYDAVAADADGSKVAVRWRPCSATSCSRESYLRLSIDAGRTFGPLRKVDDGANGPVVAVAGAQVLTASDGFDGSAKPVVRIDRWSGAPTNSTPTKVEIVTTASPKSLRLAASGDLALLAYKVGSDVFVARTDDGGATWSEPIVVATGNGDVDLDVNGSKAVVVAHTSASTWTVLHSTDTGTTWSAPETLTAGRDGATARVAIATGGTIAFGLSYADGGSRRGEVRTSTDGVTWSEATKLADLSATQVLDVAAEEDTFFASGDGQRLHRSTAGGPWLPVDEYGRVVSSTGAAERQFADAGRTAVAASARGPVVMHGSTLLRSFPDTRAPSVRLTSVPPAVTRDPRAAVRFTGSDPDAADAWLTFECAYVTTTFERCTSPFDPSPRRSAQFYDPRQAVTVRAVDAAGRTSAPVTTRWILDEAAPEVLPVTTGKVTLGARETFRWLVFERASGVASYDLRWSSTSQNASQMSRSWRTRSGVKATSVRMGVSRGKVTCLQVRARDRAGHVSAWSKTACAARPYDDRALTRSGSTNKVRNKRFVDGSATRIRPGGTVMLRGVERQSDVIVVYKRESGRRGFTIRRPGVPKASVDTAGRTTFAVVETVAQPRQRRAGAVRITGDGVLDGLVVLPRWAW